MRLIVYNSSISRSHGERTVLLVEERIGMIKSNMLDLVSLNNGTQGTAGLGAHHDCGARLVYVLQESPNMRIDFNGQINEQGLPFDIHF